MSSYQYEEAQRAEMQRGVGRCAPCTLDMKMPPRDGFVQDGGTKYNRPQKREKQRIFEAPVYHPLSAVAVCVKRARGDTT